MGGDGVMRVEPLGMGFVLIKGTPRSSLAPSRGGHVRTGGGPSSDHAGAPTWDSRPPDWKTLISAVCKHPVRGIERRRRAETVSTVVPVLASRAEPHQAPWGVNIHQEIG